MDFETAILIVVIDHTNISANPWVTVQGAPYTEPDDVPDRGRLVADELGADGWKLRTSVSFDLPGETAPATFVVYTFLRPLV